MSAIHRQNRLIKAFREMGATTPETAISPQDLGLWIGFIFHRMVYRGVFIKTGNGRFYMDEDSVAEFLEHRRFRIAIFTLIFFVLTVLILLFNRR